MFTVDGYIQGIAYHVVVGGDTDGVTPGRISGCAVTDPATAAWLDEQAGQPYKVTPTGPSGITDLADPASVLGTLIALTTVTTVGDGAPDLTGEAQPGAVY